MLAGVYLDRAVAIIGKTSERSPVVAFIGRTSPAVLIAQLNAQGVPEVQRVVRIVLGLLVAAILCVYLIALAIAFGLVASIVRNVNRLTRAARAIGRGDFSVRVATRSKDQIGELAHSFDGMAESIERLLKETARKEKLEADLAVARAIQDSFLPEAGVSWKGFQAAAHFEPIADLGGDYYDILPMADGRTAVVLGDVSGHGLPDRPRRGRGPGHHRDADRGRRRAARRLRAARPPAPAVARGRAPPLHDARDLRLRRGDPRGNAHERRAPGSVPRLRRQGRAHRAAGASDRSPSRPRGRLPVEDGLVRAGRPSRLLHRRRRRGLERGRRAVGVRAARGAARPGGEPSGRRARSGDPRRRGRARRRDASRGRPHAAHPHL